MPSSNLVPWLVLASALLAGCSASSGAEPPAPGGGEVSNPSDPSQAASPDAPAASTAAMPGGAIGSPPPASAPPARPAPQSKIRSCGVAKTTVNPLSKHTEWGTFAPVAIGQSVVSMIPFNGGARTVSGTASRFSQGLTGNAGSGPDVSADQALYELGFLTPDQLGTSTASNYGAGGPTQPTSFYVSPAPTTLTFFEGSSEQELSWSIDAPKRTSVPALPTDEFVRGITGGAYFGLELVLSFPSDCAVGALSDALGRSALLRDATPASGIFAPGVTADVQSVLVANDVTMQVRVIANKPMPAVDALLASTTCSPADIADCAKLVTAIENAAHAVQASRVASDLNKLQADTDPSWSPVTVHTAPISIASP